MKTWTMIVYLCSIAVTGCLALDSNKDEPGTIDTTKVKDVTEAQSSISEKGNLDASKYKVVPNDVLQVTVEGEPDFSQDHLWVYPEPEGLIKYAPLGDVRVVGLTLSEIEKKITELLENYVSSPRVTVSVKEHHPELESTR